MRPIPFSGDHCDTSYTLSYSRTRAQIKITIYRGVYLARCISLLMRCILRGKNREVHESAILLTMSRGWWISIIVISQVRFLSARLHALRSNSRILGLIVSERPLLYTRTHIWLSPWTPLTRLDFFYGLSLIRIRGSVWFAMRPQYMRSAAILSLYSRFRTSNSPLNTSLQIKCNPEDYPVKIRES